MAGRHKRAMDSGTQRDEAERLLADVLYCSAQARAIGLHLVAYLLEVAALALREEMLLERPAPSHAEASRRLEGTAPER
jgi:hypothetical protein